MGLDLVLLQQRFVFVNLVANVAPVLALVALGLLDFSFTHRNDRRIIVVKSIVLLQAVHNAFLCHNIIMHYFIHSKVTQSRHTVKQVDLKHCVNVNFT
jgi:hypothetical protein